MKISATEEYGLRCLLRVAEANHPVTANWVAEQEGISLAYAQKLLRQLSSEGILQAKRGAGGGFHLSRPATSISVGDAMRAFGTMVDVPSFCEKHTGERETCTRAESYSIESALIVKGMSSAARAGAPPSESSIATAAVASRTKRDPPDLDVRRK